MIKFELPNNRRLNNYLTVEDNIYTFDLTTAFKPWLKSGYNAEYHIIIQQKVNNGTIYTQEENFRFTVE